MMLLLCAQQKLLLASGPCYAMLSEELHINFT